RPQRLAEAALARAAEAARSIQPKRGAEGGAPGTPRLGSRRHRFARPRAVGRDGDESVEAIGRGVVAVENDVAEAAGRGRVEGLRGALAADAGLDALERDEEGSDEERASDRDESLLFERQEVVPVALDVEPARPLRQRVERERVERRPDLVV